MASGERIYDHALVGGVLDWSVSTEILALIAMIIPEVTVLGLTAGWRIAQTLLRPQSYQV